MGLDIKSPGAGYLNSPDPTIKFDVSDGLLGHWLLGGSLAASRRNLVKNRQSGTIVGSPSVAATHLAFGATSWLDTGIAELAEMTIMVVGKSDQADDGSKDVLWASTDQGPAAADTGRNSLGFSLMRVRTGANTTITTARWNGSASSNGQAIIGDNEDDIPISRWTLYSGRFGQTSLDLDDLTSDPPVNQHTNPSIPRDPNTNTIRIGSRYGNTGLIGASWVHQASVFNRIISAGEMAAHAAQVKRIGSMVSGLTF